MISSHMVFSYAAKMFEEQETKGQVNGKLQNKIDQYEKILSEPDMGIFVLDSFSNEILFQNN